MNILNELVEYLAAKIPSLEPGENLFYNSLPDEPDDAMLLQQLPRTMAVPSQIDGACYIVEVTSRSESNETAYENGRMVYRWLYTDKDDTGDADGLIRLNSGLTVATVMLGEPVWKQTDNNGRKYFVFRLRVFSHRII